MAVHAPEAPPPRQLPKTPTHRIEKYKLRQEGVTPDTWDREAAGIVLRR